MASNPKNTANALVIDRLATQLAKNPQSKVFLPLAEEYCKVGMWEEAVAVLEDGLKYYPGFITAMVALGRAYDQLNQPTKAKAVLEGAVELSPDNLRAHRTLMKIYASQGLPEAAMKSCNAILALNPRDEEALSTRASLGVWVNPADSTGSEMAQVTLSGTESATWSKLAEYRDFLPSNELRTVPDLPLRTDEEPPGNHCETDQVELPMPPVSEVVSGAQETDGTAGSTALQGPEDRTRGSGAGPLSQVKTVARLQSWLYAIRRQRRDRAVPGKSVA